MFEIVFFLIIIYIVFKRTNTLSGTKTLTLLNKALRNQEFTNIKTIFTSPAMNFVTGDANGENFIFAFKNNNIQFNINELTTLYEKAQKMHIHNIVIINSSKAGFSNMIQQKISDYNIEVWDLNKLSSLALANNGAIDSSSFNNSAYSTTASYATRTSHTANIPHASNANSVLRTSNTSDDKCKIDTNSYDPIQEASNKSSFFSNLFKKPERL